MDHILAIEQVRIATVELNPRNARTHSKTQIRQIAASIREFGFASPILIDERNKLIAGHGRLQAAKFLGHESVPAIRFFQLSEKQKRALALADNKIAANAGWNIELLAKELQFLCESDLDFDVSITGFAPAEIDLVIGDAIRPAAERISSRM